MKVIFPPETQDMSDLTVFLAGTIEMGKSFDWQSEFLKNFEDEKITFLNPRRKDWDPNWIQDINNPKFKEQVLWELSGIKNADIVIMYLDPESKSSISLLELGILTSTPEKVLLYCPKGFYRKGNVDIVAELFGMSSFESFEEIKNVLLKLIK